MKIEFSCEFVRLESRRITLYIVVDCVSQGFNKHEKDVRFVFKIDTAYHNCPRVFPVQQSRRGRGGHTTSQKGGQVDYSFSRTLYLLFKHTDYKPLSYTLLICIRNPHCVQESSTLLCALCISNDIIYAIFVSVCI